MDDVKNTIGKFDCFGEPATLASRWRRWFSSFELYADGKGLIITDATSNATKQRRRALLLHTAGEDVQEIFATLEETGERHEYQKAVTALNNYFAPKKNVAYARHLFRQTVQEPNETIQQYVTRLRRIGRDCEYGGALNEHIRDEVVYKCSSERLKRKLLVADNLDLK